MNHIKIKAVLCGMLAVLVTVNSVAQTSAEKNNEDGMVRDTVTKVNVAFRQIDKRDLANDVSFVNVPEIMEKNYTTYSMEGMRSLVNGYANNNLWGMENYLFLVDGVPVRQVIPTEIEQISFLKGVAAVALYGTHAVNGVVLITTKRGNAKTEKNVSVRVNTGVFVPKSYPEYLGSAEYMTLNNEAARNDGLTTVPYTDEQIYYSALGSNPYRYPNVDYYSSEYLRKFSTRTDVTTEITGGNNIAQYYTNIGYRNEGTEFKFGEAKKNYYSRFNVRGNIDVKLNSFIKTWVNVSTVFTDNRGSNTDYWNGAATLRPNRFAPLIPIDMIEPSDEASLLMVKNSNNIVDGKYLLGGTISDQTNPIASIYAGGYNQYIDKQLQFDAGLEFDLKGILEGLSFRTQFSTDYSSTYSQTYNNTYATYEPTWNNYSGQDMLTKLTKHGEDKKTARQDITGGWIQQVVDFFGQFNYKRTVDNSHNISAMVMASGYQYSVSGQYHRISSANLGVTAGYNYRHKYYADFAGNFIHSSRLAPGKREAFSPTVTLAWQIAKEDFMANVSNVDHLKLTVSAGVLNTDQYLNDTYLYKEYYTQADGTWISWMDGELVKTSDSRRAAAPDLTFTKRKEFNAGIDASLWKGQITLNGSFFINEMSGIPIEPTALYPNYFRTGWPNSSFLPWTNYDANKRVGADLAVNLNKRIGSFSYSLGVVGMYFDTEAVKRAEINKDSYQNRAGKPVDAIWGLKNAGFYQSTADVNSSTYSAFGNVKPGDIKYYDQNGDNTVDSQDEVYLGKAGWYGSPLTLGVNLTLKWKNLTLFAMGSGNYGSYAMKNNSYFWVQGNGKYSAVVRDRWTEATKETATYPRLTTLNSNNNFRNSDFWIYKTDRFDIDKVQLTFDFPKSVLRDKFISGLSIYVSGSNLLTIAKEKEILEMNIGTAPQYRFFNLGVNATF